MKRLKSWQKSFSGGLSLALALGLLAGCGGNSSAENGNSAGEGSTGGSSATNLATEETGFVYVPEFIEVQGDFADGLRNATYSTWLDAYREYNKTLSLDESACSVPDYELAVIVRCKCSDLG